MLTRLSFLIFFVFSGCYQSTKVDSGLLAQSNNIKVLVQAVPSLPGLGHLILVSVPKGTPGVAFCLFDAKEKRCAADLYSPEKIGSSGIRDLYHFTETYPAKAGQSFRVQMGSTPEYREFSIGKVEDDDAGDGQGGEVGVNFGDKEALLMGVDGETSLSKISKGYEYLMIEISRTGCGGCKIVAQQIEDAGALFDGSGVCKAVTVVPQGGLDNWIEYIGNSPFARKHAFSLVDKTQSQLMGSFEKSSGLVPTVMFLKLNEPSGPRLVGFEVGSIPAEAKSACGG